MINANTSRYDNEPGCELASGIDSVPSQPAEIILPKRIQKSGVCIHRCISTCRNGARDAQKKRRELFDKIRPRCLFFDLRRT
jgi:hypothetical protein